MENGPLQLIPWGLGNMLGLKGDVGILPSISGSLQPTVEMLDLLAGKNAIETVLQTVGVSGVASTLFSSLVVPAGETWLVRGVSTSAAAAAGELLRYRVLAYTQLALPFRQIVGESTTSLTDAVGAGNAAGASAGGPFLLYGGESLRPYVHRITTAGAINVTLAASILRFAG
jgi:hypothetical protein